MMIKGCDFHPSWQQVSWLDRETGETGERKLLHAEGEAERFYGGCGAGADRDGIDRQQSLAGGSARRLGPRFGVGDSALIRASYVRQQKTDKRETRRTF